jgi:hypothetical protein
MSPSFIVVLFVIPNSLFVPQIETGLANLAHSLPGGFLKINRPVVDIRSEIYGYEYEN